MIKLDATSLRASTPTSTQISSIVRKPIFIIVENVLDTYNVGAIFRLADAMAVSCVYLIGTTSVPNDLKVGHKIQKASVGAWKWVPWEYAKTTKIAIDMIKESYRFGNERGLKHAMKYGRDMVLQVIAIEQDKKSIPYTKCEYKYPVALIVGHETSGVKKETLKLADRIVEIPLFGVNKSLNVMVSLAIVLWDMEKNKM